MDVARLKRSFARVAMHGDEVPLHFYADLFLKHPETREMFPVSMQAQRGHLVDALVKIVASVDQADDLQVFLRDLGRDHRKFGVLADHYERGRGKSLSDLRSLFRRCVDPRARGRLEGYVRADRQRDDRCSRGRRATSPTYWTGTVVSRERKAFDITVVPTVHAEPPLE